ncbi:GTP-binding protein, partial [candidate division KSB1 bacterium]|nr:GTP-binding protein [candidate division KSB1 bacterium]
IEGLEEKHSLRKNYYMGSSGAIVVGDLTRAESIEKMEKIIREFTCVCPGAKIVLAGNKYDLYLNEMKTLAKLKNFAQKQKFDYVITSAKTGKNVQELFLLLAQKLT